VRLLTSFFSFSRESGPRAEEKTNAKVVFVR
jgi:hypothetical protein